MNRTIAAAALLAIAYVFFSFRPSTHLWSLSNGADLGSAARIAWIVFGLSIAALPVHARSGERAAAFLRRARVPGPAGEGALALLLFGLFYAFRSKNHFLGDGWLVITLLERDEDPIVTRPGMGTLFVHRALFRLVRALGVGEEFVFVLLSCAAGVLFACWVVRWARAVAPALHPEQTRGAVLLLAAVPLTVGTMQLFFGYVENYALAHLLLLAFLAEGSRVLLRGGSRIPAATFFALAAAAHWAVLALLPALLVLWPRSNGSLLGKARARLPEIGLVLLFLVPPSLAQARLVHQFHPWIAIGEEAPYGILSRDHLLFSLNFALLLAPVPILLFLLRRSEKGEGETRHEAFFRFLRVASLAGIALSLVVRPFLGPRDWDLLSLFVAPLALWVSARALVRASPRRIPSLATLAGGLGLFFLIPWVAGNTTVERGAERVARMIADDPHHYWGRKPKIVGLAWVMAERGAPEAAHRLFDRAARKRPDNAVARSNLGILLWGRGEYREAKPHLEAAVRLDPTLDPPLFYLGTVRFHLQEGDLGEEAFRRFLELVPGNPSAESYLGRVLLRKGEWEEALEHLLQARRALPENADLDTWIGLGLVRSGRGAEAVPYLERALRAEPHREDARRLLQETAGTR
ncbi:MAG: tetratricopeptide repeat protein [Candidatus Eisenbacteria bacterium]|nr:tetratricopeptide repeat protein [Candidatus Eisenbacteria bacterium]